MQRVGPSYFGVGRMVAGHWLRPSAMRAPQGKRLNLDRLAETN